MLPWIYENILTIVLLSPLLGIFVLIAMPKRHDDSSYEVALVSSIITLFLSIVLYGFLGSASLRIGSESYQWLSWINVSFLLSVDGFSSLLVIFTSAIVCLTLIINWRNIKEYKKEAMGCLLSFELAMIGFFLAGDLLLMYVFLQMSAIFLGFTFLFFKKNVDDFLPKYIGFMAVGGLIFLVLVAFLAFSASSSAISDVVSIYVSERAGHVLLILLVIFAAIQMGIFPFHGWVCADGGEAADFMLLPAGIFQIGGGYVFYRLAPVFLPAIMKMHTPLVWIIVISIFMAALIAAVQKNFASLVLYALRVHMGFVLLGIVSANIQGVTGAGMEMVSLSVSIAALATLISFFNKRGVSLIDDGIKGSLSGSPVWIIIVIIVLFSVAGIPGLSHFPGLFMMWIGLFNESWIIAMTAIVAMVVLGIPLARFAALLLYNDPRTETAFDRPRGAFFVIIILLVLAILSIGIFPNLAMDDVKRSTEATWKIFSQQI